MGRWSMEKREIGWKSRRQDRKQMKIRRGWGGGEGRVRDRERESEIGKSKQVTLVCRIVGELVMMEK